MDAKIRIIVSRAYNNSLDYVELAGPSGVTKPAAGICTGSLFMESDTGDCYVYDETAADWTKIGG